MPKRKMRLPSGAILRAWDEWKPLHSADAQIANGMFFYDYLRKEHPELLEFKYAGSDKWRIVHGWLMRAGRVKN